MRRNIVTGSASGMGAAVRELLRARGEEVVGIDRRDAEIIADLGTAPGRAAAIAAAGERMPQGFDALILCAGVANSDGRAVVAVNYFGVTELVGGLRPLLRRARGARVVAISSSAMILPIDEAIVTSCLAGDEHAALAAAEDNPLAYASSKAALSRWIRLTSIAPGWADCDILLNGVAPGRVNTPMIAPLLATAEGRERLASSAPHATPHVAEASDIAPLIAFLASAQNRYMVGQVPFCDGGKDVLMRGETP